MTHIDKNNNGRTVNNCTTYGRRKVYEVTASVVLDVCKSEWNEVVKTGEQVTKHIAYHVIAESQGLAYALYERAWGSEFQRHTLVSITPLFVIDAEIATERK